MFVFYIIFLFNLNWLNVIIVLYISYIPCHSVDLISVSNHQLRLYSVLCTGAKGVVLVKLKLSHRQNHNNILNEVLCRPRLFVCEQVDARWLQTARTTDRGRLHGFLSQTAAEGSGPRTRDLIVLLKQFVGRRHFVCHGITIWGNCWALCS